MIKGKIPYSNNENVIYIINCGRYDATDSINDDTNIRSAQVIRELMQLRQYNKRLASAKRIVLSFKLHHPTYAWTSKIREHCTKERLSKSY